MDIIEQTNLHIMPTYARNPVVLADGHGATCHDAEGKTYLDFGSGIGTMSFGYCNPKWAEAVCEQVNTLQHTSNLFYHVPQAQLAEKLCQMSGYAKLFYANSGAEANECAIKLAKKYSTEKYSRNRNVILTLVNSFHGRTITTLSATGQDVFHQYFYPFTGGFRFVQANQIEDLYKNLDENVCAIMIEYVQGEGGVMALDETFVQEIRKICTEKDILMIADEVQTGIGRTGKLFAGEHYHCHADITTTAKGLGGGLPIGVCLADEKFADVLNSGSHGSTFGGNPVVCAGALAILNQITPELLNEVQEKGDFLRRKLTSLEEVVSVSGLGLMIGIQLKTKTAAAVRDTCLKKGLLVLTAKDRVRLLPPLNISRQELETGAEILCQCISAS